MTGDLLLTFSFVEFARKDQDIPNDGSFTRSWRISVTSGAEAFDAKALDAISNLVYDAFKSCFQNDSATAISSKPVTRASTAGDDRREHLELLVLEPSRHYGKIILL